MDLLPLSSDELGSTRLPVPEGRSAVGRSAVGVDHRGPGFSFLRRPHWHWESGACG